MIHDNDQLPDCSIYVRSCYMKHSETLALAIAAGLSVSRLSHLFHAQVGVTPMQYLERLRIQHARELLLMSGRSVSEVAYAVGFENPLYFSRVFRRHAATSPRAFRKFGR